MYDFVAEGEDELSVTAGECLKIAPKQRQPRIRGWLLASVDGKSKGIVPANYIKVMRSQETITNLDKVTKNNAKNLALYVIPFTRCMHKHTTYNLQFLFKRYCNKFSFLDSWFQERKKSKQRNTTESKYSPRRTRV